MNWHEARRRIWPLSRGPGDDGPAAPPSLAARSPFADARERELSIVPSPPALSVCVASGKGGTGKSVVSASLATVLARRGRTLLVDADLGVGNAHILQDVAPARSFVDVVEGRASVREARVACRPGLDLVAGGSGVSRMAGLSAYELHQVAHGIEAIEREYAHVVVDSAAGISQQTVAFAAASDLVLLVTTPDVTALTDAYAFFKVLSQRRPDAATLLVVNRAQDAEEGLHVSERMRSVAHRFVGREPAYLGALPDDRSVLRSVNERRPAVLAEPGSDFARAFEALGEALARELETRRPRGLGRTLAAGSAHAAGAR